jgi:hypothetical protein
MKCLKMNVLITDSYQNNKICKKYFISLGELNFLVSFAFMIAGRINIWSWRSSKIDAVKQAV